MEHPGFEAAEGEALLERSLELDELDGELDGVTATGDGRAVLVAGEAGIGKTALLRAFRDRRGAGSRFLWGACDPLFTPRPLGPVFEIADQLGGRLRALVAEGAKPFEVGSALLDALAGRPTVVVFEDLHWADEASLDVIEMLARRIATVPALVLASYRDDDLGAGHPLRIVLGELARQTSVRRLRLGPLSQAGVAGLAEPHGVDPGELHRLTGGNPFFVTEALAAGADRIPPTVRDAVLARVGRLAEPSRRVLEAVAVGSHATELWLLEALAPGDPAALDACLDAGVLVAGRDSVAFRHELARLAVEGSVAPGRAMELHRAALDALSEPPGGTPDLARLAHHAEAAGDTDAVLRFAPQAAVRAGAVGAHREAAGQLDRALRHADGLPSEERARLLGLAAHEYLLVGRATETIALRREAIALHRAAGRAERQGASLRAVSWPLWLLGGRPEAEVAAREAVSVLAGGGSGSELAEAYRGLATLALMADDREATLAWGTRAIEVAETADDRDLVIRTQTAIGAMQALRGEDAGREAMERGLAHARATGDELETATVFAWLSRAAGRRRSYGEASRYAAAGVEFCVRHDLEGSRPYLIALRSEWELAQGDWQLAAESASSVLDGGGRGPATVTALSVVGRLRARRGDDGQWAVLDRALELAQGTEEPSRLVPVAAARAEAAWLEGRDEAAVAEIDVVWDLAQSRGDPWLLGELARWRQRAGAEARPGALAEPYARALAGDWRGEAALWRKLGCPYESALAEADGDDDHARRALQTLHGLGASAAAAVITRRLQARGTRGLPRGPRAKTSANPAQLTDREVEVLGLLADGMRNAQIADRLVVSVRTVDHHVSAVLRKLDVGSRGQAAAAARRLGLAPPT